MAEHTAYDLLEMLRRHYQPEGKPAAGVFAPEIQAPASNRRADLIFLPTTVAGGTGIRGHEIKCSRSDLLNELRDPTKSDPWGKHCRHWWLVVSTPALVDGLEEEIPESWGVLAPPSGRRTRTMTVLRKAPVLEPADPAPALATLAAWQLYNDHALAGEERARANRLEREVELMRRELIDLRAGGQRRDPKVARVLSIIEQADSRLRDSPIYSMGVTDEEIITALVDRHTVAQIASTLRSDVNNLVQQITTACEPLRFTRERLAKLETESIVLNNRAARAVSGG